MRDYLDYLPAFEKVVLCLDHPVTHPFLRRYFLALKEDFFFVEGEFVHEDEVEADADAENIAFLVVKVLLVEIQVWENLEVLLFDDQITVFAALPRILLL